jgi:hypothetical protein
MGANLDALDPDLKQGCLELQQACSQAGIIPTVTSTVRSARDQDFLWRRYKSGNSILPAAPVGHSAHEYGWAFDMVVSPSEWQGAVGKAWEQSWGGKWGGVKDPVHFELPGASQMAWQLGEQGAQTLSGQVATRQEGLFGKVFDIALGTFVPVYSGISMAAALAQMVPGLSQSMVLDWMANPGKYPDLEFLQELVSFA